MSLLSGNVVAEEDFEVEECFSSQAHPAREARVKTAKQEKNTADVREAIFFIFVNLTIRQEPTPPMGCTPHDVIGSSCVNIGP